MAIPRPGSGVDRVSVREGPLGRGIYARHPLRPGDSILEFSGRLLTHRQVLALSQDQAYALQIGPDHYLDTEPPGRYTNHSCAPNAGIRADRVLVALRAIGAGEEIRFDYSTTMSENHWTLACRCGEPACRRRVEDFHLLAPALQQYYIRRGVVQRFIIREWVERRRRAIASSA
jgi:hypothetical protein